MKTAVLFAADVIRGLTAIVVTLAMAALIIGAVYGMAGAEPWPSAEAVKHHPRAHGSKWAPPAHVLRYRGVLRHPRYYGRPSCLFYWDSWVATGEPYWRLRYLACVL